MTDPKQTTELQTVSSCAEKREECQDKLKKIITDNHTEVIGAIGEVGKEVAYMKGKLEATPIQTSQAPSMIKEIIVGITSNWAPWILVLIVLGVVALLKAQNWFK